VNEPAGDLIELTVDVDGEAAEAVCELFERYGGGAVVQLDVAEGAESGRDLPVPLTHVRTYIAADDLDARARVEVGLWHLGRLYHIPEAGVRKLARANWAEAWKAQYSPQRIGERFLVVPSWHEPAPEPGDIVIRMDPGMSFGTGLHPTTRLCLAALEHHLAEGQRVLDVGTGSGILAVGAALLGASHVTAIDISSDAVATARENARRNGVAVDVFTGELADLPPGGFNVIAANLLAATVIDLSPKLPARLLPGGTLIASGILSDQRQSVESALLTSGLGIAEVRTSGDWVAIVAALGRD